jgi:hypothetical protein
LKGSAAAKTYRLLGADGSPRECGLPGRFGGNRSLRIYGRLDCASAIRALPRGYAGRRVFFLDEESAIAAGYRPCGRCMPAEFRAWRSSRSGA